MMPSSPLRSSRPANDASFVLEGTSPRLPPPFNPSPNAFTPPVQSYTSRSSPVGEALEPLYSIMEGDGSELPKIPQSTGSHPLNIPRSRATSLSRASLYTQVQTQVQTPRAGPSPEISVVSGRIPHSRCQVQQYRTYGRQSSPSSSPYGQGIPFPTSSPLSFSPLVDQPHSPPLSACSPAMSVAFRPLSPPSSKQGSPDSINIFCSQFHSSSFRSPSQSSQSHFQRSHTALGPFPSTSPPSASSSSFGSSRQSSTQQSFSNAYEVHGNAPELYALRDGVQQRSPPLGHVSRQGSPTYHYQCSPVNTSQHASPVNSEMTTLYEHGFAAGYGPGTFRDEEIHASFSQIAAVGPLDSFPPSVAYEAEGAITARAMPISRSTSRARRSSFGDQMQRDCLHEMEVSAPPPVESSQPAGMTAHGDQRSMRSRASFIRSQGSASGARASVFIGDSVMAIKGQEAHGMVSRERGHGRRMSNASIRSTSSRGSHISGPAQSPSQAMLASSRSQAQTFSSMSSLGIGLGEIEREERRSKSFFCRKLSGSSADRDKEDKLSPCMRYGVTSGEQGDVVSSNNAHDAGLPQCSKGTSKHGSLISMSKHTAVAEQQNEGYNRAEKYVSMAVMSILSPSTIRALSPLGDVLIKAAHTVSYVGHEAAPIVKDALSLSTHLLAFAPVPGLDEAAKALLNVWDSCQKVDTNRLSCLRLVERCATLLYAVRREISEAGEDVAIDLAAPLAQLCTALNSVHSFLESQIHRSLLSRYMRRDEITGDLAACNQVITDAAERFGISVQIRTLRELYAAEHESRQFVEEALQSMQMDNHLMHTQILQCIQSHSFVQCPGPVGIPAGNALGLTLDGEMDARLGYSQISTTRSLMPYGGGNGSLPNTPAALTWHGSSTVDDAASPTPTRTTFLSMETMTTTTTQATVALSHTIAGVHRAQDFKDADADVAALRGRFADAIDTGNDAELLHRFEIGEGEIPEATMTLGRVFGLQRQVDGEEHEGEQINKHGMDEISNLTSGGGSNVAGNFPHWMIKRSEVSQTRKIGTSFFSDVYLGHWQGRMVVVKALKPSIPQVLFVREINIWHSLDHPNVLPLYGASSTTDEPWFFVSKFCGMGNLVDWLRAKPGTGEANEGRVDLLGCIHDIAKGMEYLHAQGVLHGNLKGANVLVDEEERCVISDFGHSEMKAEGYQLSEQTMPIGKPQWKAPEVLLGKDCLTPAADVYAFAICCVETLGMGDFPMGKMDDGLFVASVLDKDLRPEIPKIDSHRDVVGAIKDLINSCWARDPAHRPSFAQVVRSLEEIRRREEHDEHSPCGLPMGHVSSGLPKLAPIYSTPLPPANTGSVPAASNESSPSDEQYETASEALTVRTASVALSESVASTGGPTSAESGISNVAIHISSNPNSGFSHLSSHESSHLLYHAPTHHEGTLSAADEQYKAANNGEQYRLNAGRKHAFHESLTLPLWSPTPVDLGAVGYLDKSTGQFITLFNAFEPPRCAKADLGHVPSFYGYGGKLPTSSREGGKRNVAQRGLSVLSGFLTFRARGDRSSPERIARQYSFPLEKGKTAAHLCVERTLHRFIEDLAIPKTWFKLQVDPIMDIFGSSLGIGKQDLIVVVGALDALDYALFVSDAHPDGRTRFNVFSERKKGEPWGMFTTERAMENGGSGYLTSQSRWVEIGEGEQALFTSKVSTVQVSDTGSPLPSDGMDTVLLAGLRFEKDQEEPSLV